MSEPRCTYRFSDGLPCTRTSGHAPSHQYLAVDAAPSEASTSLDAEAWDNAIAAARETGSEALWLGNDLTMGAEPWFADAGEEPTDQQVSGATRLEALQRLAERLREDVEEPDDG